MIEWVSLICLFLVSVLDILQCISAHIAPVLHFLYFIFRKRVYVQYFFFVTLCFLFYNHSIVCISFFMSFTIFFPSSFFHHFSLIISISYAKIWFHVRLLAYSKSKILQKLERRSCITKCFCVLYVYDVKYTALSSSKVQHSKIYNRTRFL